MEKTLIVKEQNECVICLHQCDNISEMFLEKNCKCKYYLHKECLVNWINMHEVNNCLMCEEEVVLKESNYTKCGRVICLPRNQVVIKYTIYKILLVLGCCFMAYLFVEFVFLYICKT